MPGSPNALISLWGMFGAPDSAASVFGNIVHVVWCAFIIPSFEVAGRGQIKYPHDTAFVSYHGLSFPKILGTKSLCERPASCR